MHSLIAALVRAGIDSPRILPHADMAQWTTFRVGGEADLLVQIASSQEILAVLREAHRADVPTVVVGNGSNLLVRDGGIPALVLRVASDMSGMRRDGNCLLAQAGATLAACARFAQRQGLDGLAELGGIPGTVGGGVIMNAGAYGREMADVVEWVEAISLNSLERVRLRGEQAAFSYRSSALADAGLIVTRVAMRLTPGDASAIAARMEHFAAARREKQPLDYPSAGSTFKRPPGLFAARLIDECGLRGLRVGDAMVSTRHAGFIVNAGHATAGDILSLMDEVTRRVREATGVTLEPEIRILGRDPIQNRGSL